MKNVLALVLVLASFACAPTIVDPASDAGGGGSSTTHAGCYDQHDTAGCPAPSDACERVYCVAYSCAEKPLAGCQVDGGTYTPCSDGADPTGCPAPSDSCHAAVCNGFDCAEAPIQGCELDGGAGGSGGAS